MLALFLLFSALSVQLKTFNMGVVFFCFIILVRLPALTALTSGLERRRAERDFPACVFALLNNILFVPDG